MLHADADFSIAVESAIETHNVGGVTLVQHLQLPNDLVPNGWFDLQVDQLEHRRRRVLFMFSHHTERDYRGFDLPFLRTRAHTQSCFHHLRAHYIDFHSFLVDLP